MLASKAVEALLVPDFNSQDEPTPTAESSNALTNLLAVEKLRFIEPKFIESVEADGSTKISPGRPFPLDFELFMDEPVRLSLPRVLRLEGLLGLLGLKVGLFSDIVSGSNPSFRGLFAG